MRESCLPRSPSTILYYEAIGLLPLAPRTAGNYRAYGEGHLSRLRQICIFREAGLKLEDIRALLDLPDNEAESVLQRRFSELALEIETLRGLQAAICGFCGANRSSGEQE